MSTDSAESIQALICFVLSVPFFLFAYFAPEWIFQTRAYKNSLMGTLSIKTSRIVYAGFGGFFVLLAILGATGNLERLLQLIDKLPT